MRLKKSKTANKSAKLDWDYQPPKINGGMETIRGIYKKNRRNGTLFGFSVSTEIKVLMGITA
ncbi:hypothetical protein LAP9435_3137 [Lactiplantibacillus plantarum]|nr:hypothetical protein LAP8962_03078 [Lactiplantibacillus plantarum]VFI65613.1 hypothetical protein LAP9434_03158 [Lactiplantibacillus plantarum]VFQ58103.1 hypothetical protein LAP9435_3137 [Lactiplantibacillus plantarum]